jgi:hypothetical protein
MSVYATSGQACSGDLLIQPGRRAHRIKVLGGNGRRCTIVSIHKGLGAIQTIKQTLHPACFLRATAPTSIDFAAEPVHYQPYQTIRSQ